MPTPEEIRKESLAVTGFVLAIAGVVLWSLAFVGAYLGTKATKLGKSPLGEAAVVVGLVVGCIGITCMGGLVMQRVWGV